MPRIPVDHLDVLIVDEMGKDISGVGMDPNVIGFWRRDGGERKPDYQTLILLDLTAHSKGNALGMGFVDLTTKRVMDQVDFQATYANALTTGIWRSVRFPVTLEKRSGGLGCGALAYSGPLEAPYDPDRQYTEARHVLGHRNTASRTSQAATPYRV